MTAVIYARYSSDNQREESIEGQIRECTAYAEKNGITVVKHYIDRALSAKTDNRPDFQQMIKDSEKRLFDIVLVWKLDRFARNRYDSAHYEYQLERNHVKLVSATEPISDSPAGIMVKSMLTGMAEYYSAELSEKVVRGMTENVLKGKYNGGTIPIGFKVDGEKFFQVDPLKAPFVVEAFQRYNDGATMKELMNWLNDSGVTTNRNQKFTYNSVQKLLTNKRYIGENHFKDIVMPDSIPAIVDKDLFEEVQLKIKKNSRAPARHKAEDDYLLTTKLFCGMCGAMMFGECGTGRNKVVHHYYKCATAKRFKTCKKKTVRKEWLEDLVIAETMKLIQDDAVIDAIVAEVMELQDQENTTLPLLEKQMREVENGIENMLNAIQAGVLTNSTKSRLEKLEAQQKELEVRIAEEKIARPRLSENQVRFWLTRFRKLDPNVKSHRETLINTFVNAVYLYDEKVLITFNYKDGTKTITFDEIAAKDAPEGNGSDLGCFAPPRTPVSNGYRSFCFTCLEKGAARVDSNSIDPPNSPAGKKAPVQQRRPLPAAETGRSCWGCGQQDARAAQGTMQPLGAATRVPFLRGSRHLPAHILHLSLTCDTIQVTETTQTEDFSMIYDTLNNLPNYLGVSDNLDTVIEYIMARDITTLPAGRTRIDGDKAVVTVSTVTPQTSDKALFQRHDNHITLETDLDGSELFEVSLAELTPTKPTDEAADTTVGTAGTSIAGMLCEGRFALYLAGEPYKSGLKAQGCGKLKKAVFSIELDPDEEETEE